MKKLATALLFLSSAAIASSQTSQAPKSLPSITFRDITAQAGIQFLHNNAAFGKKYLPETMGPGVAFIDYDNDGWPDIFLINGTNWPGQPSKHSTPKLYRNNHDGTFTNVTHKAGLDIELFGMGVAVGDYDNDGFDDLLVTALGQSHLFHNNGNGTFTDVTQKAGLLGPKEFSTSAAWVDYDKDGKLDLVVANYVQWSIETDLYCTLDGKSKSYCTPESYKGTSVRLWHNRGDGIFEDVTKKTGLGDPTSKTLGIAIIDYDNDGWPDLFIANGHIDSDIERVQPNVKYAMPPHLFRNVGKGNFQEVANSLGKSFNTPRVGRGAAYADINNDGRLDLLLSTNGGPAYLFLNEATGPTTINNSLRIKLVGTKSNRDGIGAVVKRTAGGETQSQM